MRLRSDNADSKNVGTTHRTRCPKCQESAHVFAIILKGEENFHVLLEGCGGAEVTIRVSLAVGMVQRREEKENGGWSWVFIWRKTRPMEMNENTGKDVERIVRIVTKEMKKGKTKEAVINTP